MLSLDIHQAITEVIAEVKKEYKDGRRSQVVDLDDVLQILRRIADKFVK